MDEDIDCLLKIRETLLMIPFFGYRKVFLNLAGKSHGLSEKKVRRLMHQHGLFAIYAKPNLSSPCKNHKKYPYLLSGIEIRYPNQVWVSDITYIKINGCFVYLTAILDLFSRKVLSWRVSNTMDSYFCIEALEEALQRFGVPAIFNTDQGSQFTAAAFIAVLERESIRISMDGKGRALDNVYIERLWRSLKYEDIYLKSYEDLRELKEGVKKYFDFYNQERFHQALDYQTPEEMYESFKITEKEEKVA